MHGGFNNLHLRKGVATAMSKGERQGSRRQGDKGPRLTRKRAKDPSIKVPKIQLHAAFAATSTQQATARHSSSATLLLQAASHIPNPNATRRLVSYERSDKQVAVVVGDDGRVWAGLLPRDITRRQGV